jgi:galactose-1-phosphate uridylyltransferase
MDQPTTRTCPLTGRVGSYVPGRDGRPGAPRLRGVTEPSVDSCPFCTGDVPTDPHPATARRGGSVWRSCPNRYPAVAGQGAGAHVVYGRRHRPELTADAPTEGDDWGALFDAQQQLARRTRSWSLLVTNIGPTSGASQDHPHGQVLHLASPPPVVVERTRRLASPEVVRAVLADDLTVEAAEGVRLVVPAVPFGPGDLRLVPERDGSFLDTPPDTIARLVTRWTAEVRRDTGRSAPDGKVVVHEPVEGRGRWYVDLLATDRHGPVAGITPFVELDAPSERRAQELRARGDR